MAGLSGNVVRATLGLRGLAHAVPGDVDVLLVSPTGQTLVPLAFCGGTSAVVGAGVDLTFSDASASVLTAAPLSSGTFHPTNRRGSNTFAAPAPLGPYGSNLSSFNGFAPGGAWSLYVSDQSDPGSGALQRGWTLTLTTAVANCLDTSTDLLVALQAITAEAVAGQPFTAICQLVNQSPHPASGVQATLTLPPGATFLGASAPQGSVAFSNGVVSFTADFLAGLGSTPVALQFAPAGSGAQTLQASATLLQADTDTANNAATLNLSVLVDSDGDGLPDVWENLYGFNPANHLDAALDADGDGQSNLAEFLAGTDPRSARSGLRILSVVKDGSGYSVTFASVSGRSYRLERRGALESGTWATVQSGLPGTGGNVVVTDPAPPPGKQFYRVALLP